MEHLPDKTESGKEEMENFSLNTEHPTYKAFRYIESEMIEDGWSEQDAKYAMFFALMGFESDFEPLYREAFELAIPYWEELKSRAKAYFEFKSNQ